MKKRWILAAVMVLAVFVMATMTGCSAVGGALLDAAGDLNDEIEGLTEDLENSTYFNNYASEDKDREFVMTGQIHHAAADDDDAMAIRVTASEDVDIHVTGTYIKKKKSEGELSLVYMTPEGGKVIVADQNTEDIDLTLTVKKGEGFFRFEGEDAVYNFELHFSKAEGVTYDWDGMDEFMEDFEDSMDDMLDDLNLPVDPDEPIDLNESDKSDEDESDEED